MAYFRHLIRKIALAALLCSPFLPSFALPRPAQALHTESKLPEKKPALVHRDLTVKTLELYFSQFPDSPLRSYQDELIQGSLDEDNQPFYTNCAKHYFNPLSCLGLKTVLGQTDALTYAQELWQQAIELFSEERVRPACYTLGRVLHLLQDNTLSPAHVFLVDHLSKCFQEKNGPKLDEKYLEQLKALGLDLFQDKRVIVLDEGDPFEDAAALCPLEKILTQPKKEIITASSLDELFTQGALEIAQPKDQRLTEILNKYYSPNPQGNGQYRSREAATHIADDDAFYLAQSLAPKALARGAGLLSLWANQKSPPKVGLFSDFKLKEMPSGAPYYDLVCPQEKRGLVATYEWGVFGEAHQTKEVCWKSSGEESRFELSTTFNKPGVIEAMIFEKWEKDQFVAYLCVDEEWQKRFGDWSYVYWSDNLILSRQYQKVKFAPEKQAQFYVQRVELGPKYQQVVLGFNLDDLNKLRKLNPMVVYLRLITPK